MDVERTASRRAVLRGAGATGLGVTSLVLPSAAASASTLFTTGQGDASLAMYVDAAQSASWPGTGGTWIDLTGSSRSLPVGGSGQPVLAASSPAAFDFVATSGVATTPSTLPDFAFGAQWSIAAWVRFSSLTGWQNILTQGDSVLADGGGAIAYDNQLYFQKATDDLASFGGTSWSQAAPTTYSTSRGANRLGLALERGTGEQLFCSAATPVVTGVWYHVVATGTSSAVTLFVDGAVAATAGSPSAPLSELGGSLKARTDGRTVKTLVGSDALVPSGQQLRGSMAFLQVWTRALTAAEVAAQYVATKGPYHLA